MEEQAQHTPQEKQGTGAIAVGAGVAAGGVAAYGAVRIAENHVARNYGIVEKNYLSLFEQYKQHLQNEDIKELYYKSRDALDKTKEELKSPEKLAIATIAFVGIGLTVGAIVYALGNHEKPNVIIDPVTVELSQQQVAHDASEQTTFVK